MIYTVIICIIFFAALAMWLVRFAKESGFRLPDNRVLNFVTEKKAYTPLCEKTTGKECAKIFIYALIFRIILFFAGWFAYGIFAKGAPQTLPEYCSRWNLWDSPHYIEIAQYGYGHQIEDGNFYMLVFFPLYPVLIRIFSMFLHNYIVSGLVVSTLSYCFGCMLMYKLVAIDYSKPIAKKSVMFMSVFPFAFFFGGIMTESLFFLLVIATFLAIRQHRWFAVGILGMLSALSRSFGVLMIIPAAVEWIQTYHPVSLIREKNFRLLGSHVVRALPIIIIPVGTLIYLYINYQTAGDPFIFLKYQREHWYQELQFFGKTTNMLWSRTMAFSDRWTDITSLFMPELILIPIFAGIILYSVRRTRSMYVAFMFVYFIFNVGASWPLSMSRYLSCMFPVFWVIAEFTDRHKNLELPVTAVMAVIMGIYFTGYITAHQIM